jgi:rhodanese-related sulfurtransferase
MKEACPVNRWDLIKAGLKNLPFKVFFSSASADKDAILIDVRTNEEVEQQAYKGAKHIDYLSYELADQLEQLDKSKTYYVFCKTSRRSSRVCIILENLGFPKVFNLKEGLNGAGTL